MLVTGIIVLGVAVYAVWAVRKIRKDRKNGACCGGSCSGYRLLFSICTVGRDVI